MKAKLTTLALVGDLSFSGSQASAGGMAEPIMEAEVIAEEAAGTAGGWVIPLILIAVIAAVAAGSSSETPVPLPTPTPGQS